MIDDCIEFAYANGIVRTVVQNPDGYDDYLLARASGAGPPITVRVRPDGRFSRATSSEGLLTIGQVMALCGLGRRDAQTTAPTLRGEVAR